MLRSKTMLSAGVAAILIAAGAALPAAAQEQAPAPSASAPAAGPSAGTGMHHHHHQQAGDPVEARITDLHQKLQITAEQEPQWNTVAQTMRDNAKATADLVKQAQENQAKWNAVEDLNGYAQIAESHAQGVRKLADAFGALYATMSDSQKKVADQVFEHHRRQHQHHG